MLIINSKEFRNHQKKYFEMVDKNEQIIVKRKNHAYKLVRASNEDLLSHIPEEFRCDPYEISPSGDIYWADKRNVDMIKKIIEEEEKSKNTRKTINSKEELKNYLAGL